MIMSLLLLRGGESRESHEERVNDIAQDLLKRRADVYRALGEGIEQPED